MENKILSKDGYKIVNLNRRRAIREKCLNCTGWTYKKITRCSIDDCLLYPFRTGKGNQKSVLRTKAIRGYCLWCMNKQVGEIRKCTCFSCPLFIFRKGHLDKTKLIDAAANKVRKKILLRNKFTRASGYC
jgi:hypothetical protein